MYISTSQMVLCGVIAVGIIVVIAMVIRQNTKKELIKKLMITSAKQIEDIIKDAWKESINSWQDRDIITANVIRSMYQNMLFNPKEEYIFFAGSIMHMNPEIFDSNVTQKSIIADMLLFAINCNKISLDEARIFMRQHNIHESYLSDAVHTHVQALQHADFDAYISENIKKYSELKICNWK